MTSWKIGLCAPIMGEEHNPLKATHVLHRVFDVRTLPFGVSSPPLEGPVSGSELGASIELGPPSNPPSSPRELSPIECSRSEEALSSIPSSGEADVSAFSEFPDSVEITPDMIEAGVRALWNTSLVEFPNPADRLDVRTILEAALHARANPR